MSFLDDLNDMVGDIGDVAKTSVGIYGEIVGAIDRKPQPQPEPKPIPQPEYKPNLSAGDFAFKPNLLLVGGGILLLVIILGRK